MPTSITTSPSISPIFAANLRLSTRAILENHRGFLRYVQDCLLRVLQFAERARIPAPHSHHVLRALAHRLHLLRADLEWVDAELSALAPEEERMAHPSG